VIRDGKPRTLVATLGALGDADVAGERPVETGKAPARSERNAFGIVGQDLSPEQRTRMGLGPKEGVLIVRVDNESARDAGLQPGDVVLAVGRTDVGSAAALDAQLRAAGTDRPVMLLIRREGGTRYVAVSPKKE
jgi:serine protease Do